MCETGGINHGQMKLSIGQTEQTLGMAQEWLEQLHHLARSRATRRRRARTSRR